MFKMKKKKCIDKVLDSLYWHDAWLDVPPNSGQKRFEDDSVDGNLTVIFSIDGDAWIETFTPRNQLRRSLRFREPSTGGGQSSRVRKALMILAMAIKADNEENPQRKNYNLK